jgi:hypothetical protein
MARLKQIVTDFTSGEISPKMIARTDLESFKHGAKTMSNAYPLPHGACTRRRGTTFVAEVRNSTKTCKLLPYIYSRTLSYMLVFNDGYMRVVRNGAYILSGGSPYELAIPYADADLTSLRFTQVGTALYIVHKNYPPKILKREDDTDWTLTNATFEYRAVTDFWYENYFIKFKIISGTTAFKINDSFNIAATAGTVTDVAPANVGNGTITAVSFKNSAPTETWTVLCTYADSNRQEWTVTGSVSGVMQLTWTTNDYPSTICFHEQRLYFGSSPSSPQTIWASSTGNYNVFTRGAKDDDAIQFTIASNQYDELIHLASGRYLMPLTYGGEFSMTGSNTTGITPSTVRITPHTYHGSNDCIPIKIGNEVLFVQRDGAKVRAISYSVAEDTNMAPDITVLAEHVSESGIKESTFAQSPDYLSWWVRNDGILLSCVHMRDFNMTGWSRHTTQDGLFENVASIPESNQDTVYLIVKRFGNKRYIEFFNYYDDVNTDASLSGTAITATNSWSGLDHLNGKTVTVVGDGNVLPSVVVSGGSVTINKAVNKVQIGLPFSTLVELQHPDVQNEHGSSQGGRLSISKITARVQNTVGMKINGVDVPFREFGQVTDTAITPYNGEITRTNLGWSNAEYIRFEQTYPLPWTLLSVVMFVNSYD